jgi:hypothetical protein
VTRRIGRDIQTYVNRVHRQVLQCPMTLQLCKVTVRCGCRLSISRTRSGWFACAATQTSFEASCHESLCCDRCVTGTVRKKGRAALPPRPLPYRVKDSVSLGEPVKNTREPNNPNEVDFVALDILKPRRSSISHLVVGRTIGGPRLTRDSDGPKNLPLTP